MDINVLDLIIRSVVTGSTFVRTVKPRMLHRTERARTENEGENSAYGVFLDKPNGKRQLGRPKIRWEDNVLKNLDTCVKGSRDSTKS